jgi:hypothetical protein
MVLQLLAARRHHFVGRGYESNGPFLAVSYFSIEISESEENLLLGQLLSEKLSLHLES